MEFGRRLATRSQISDVVIKNGDILEFQTKSLREKCKISQKISQLDCKEMSEQENRKSSIYYPLLPERNLAVWG